MLLNAIKISVKLISKLEWNDMGGFFFKRKFGRSKIFLTQSVIFVSFFFLLFLMLQFQVTSFYYRRIFRIDKKLIATGLLNVISSRHYRKIKSSKNKKWVWRGLERKMITSVSFRCHYKIQLKFGHHATVFDQFQR